MVWSALRSLVGRETLPPALNRYPAALDRCLAALPPSRRRRFRRLVERARAAEALREDSHFMIFRSMPVARAFAIELGRRFTRRGLIERSEDVLFLQGRPVSAGVTEGRARLIYSPAEFHKLQPGEVLVCRYTSPAWTPLLSVAAAVVAETGGAASHAAIVAREYGIPAVMGVQSALSLIRDGQRVRVDGRIGEVRVL